MGVDRGGDGGSNAAVVAIFVIALIVILILLYGFAVGHWFNFGSTVNVVTSPGQGGASATPSVAASPTASPTK
jgi:hypothetical protein